MDILSIIPSWVIVVVLAVVVLAVLAFICCAFLVILFVVLPLIIVVSVVRSATRKAHEVVQRVSPLPIPKLPL